MAHLYTYSLSLVFNLYKHLYNAQMNMSHVIKHSKCFYTKMTGGTKLNVSANLVPNICVNL